MFALFTAGNWDPYYDLKARRYLERIARVEKKEFGLCEKLCPVHAISLRNGYPEWVKEQCTLCLGCLSYCPKEAINYEEGFLKYGRYTHSGVDPDF